MKLTYNEAKELLHSQGKFHICLGLERTLAVLNLLGNPQNKIKVVHTAGTNGKGSVSSILANILKAAGYKTGLYTSPHLVEYTERIKINNTDISEADFAEYISKICNIADENGIHLTEFEILTVCAFLYFYNNKTDIAVIETGLGGRFDATNTVNDKILAIITSISLDHTDRLGDTIEKIAYEKAGIITDSSDVVISPDNKGFQVVRNLCENNKNCLYAADFNVETLFENGQNYLLFNGNKYEFSLLGLYQKKNAALIFKAVECLQRKGFEITDEAIKIGLKTAVWHARLEYLKDKNILIDGAHNPDAALELKKSLDYYFKNQKRKFIYSTLNTKDYKTVAKMLFNSDDEIYYYEFNNNNAVTYEEYIKNVSWLRNIKKAADSDLKDILDSDGLKIITGSLYMIGEILTMPVMERK